MDLKKKLTIKKFEHLKELLIGKTIETVEMVEDQEGIIITTSDNRRISIDAINNPYDCGKSEINFSIN